MAPGADRLIPYIENDVILVDTSNAKFVQKSGSHEGAYDAEWSNSLAEEQQSLKKELKDSFSKFKYGHFDVFRYFYIKEALNKPNVP